MEKMTKMEKFGMVVEMVEMVKAGAVIEMEMLDILDEFAKYEIELLEKRATRKPAQKKVKSEDLVIQQAILDVLEEFDGGLQVKEVQEKDDRLAEFSIQKLSAMIKKLAEDGKVEKEIKGKLSLWKFLEQAPTLGEFQKI